MPRTTIDLDPAVLTELKRKGQREGKSLGQVASEVLAAGLDRQARPTSAPFEWTTRPMGARIDLDDKEAVHRALDT